MIWKFPSRTSLFHHQSWWCASFRYSCNCNRMPTSVDIHISKDDGMKMSFNTSLPLLVNCFLLSFLQMQLYAQSINIHVSKDDDMKMFFRYIFAPQSFLVILLSFIQMQLYAYIDQYPFFIEWRHEDVLQVHLCPTISLRDFASICYSFQYNCMPTLIDTTKRLMSFPKCRSVEVINNPAKLGLNHKKVNCINYK